MGPYDALAARRASEWMVIIHPERMQPIFWAISLDVKTRKLLVSLFGKDINGNFVSLLKLDGAEAGSGLCTYCKEQTNIQW